MAFAGPAPQGFFATIHDWVKALANSRAPQFEKAQASPLLPRLKSRLALFCTVPASPATKNKPLAGEAAAIAKFAAAKAQATTSQPVTYATLQSIMAFAWLLPEDQRNDLIKMMSKAVVDSVGACQSKASSSSSSGDAAKKKAKKSEAKSLVKVLYS